MKPLFASKNIDIFGHKFELALSTQFALLASFLFVVTYAVLFTSFLPLHNGFHEFRHSFGLIACH